MRGYLQSMGTLLVSPPLKKMSFPPLAASKYLEISGRWCREGCSLMSSSHSVRTLAGHPPNLLFFCLPFWVFPEPGGGWPMSHFGCVCNSHLFSVLRRLKSL